MTNPLRNRQLRIWVTLGLAAGYAISVKSSWQRGHTASALGNAILLPTSLVWLWLVTDNYPQQSPMASGWRGPPP